MMSAHIFWDWVKSLPLSRRDRLLSLFIEIKTQQLQEQIGNNEA